MLFIFPQADLPWPFAQLGILPRHDATCCLWASTHCRVGRWVVVDEVLSALPSPCPAWAGILSPAMQDPLLILGLMTLWPGWGSGILTAAELREVGVGDLDSWAKLTGERENCST